MEGIGKVLCPHLLEVAVSGFHCKLSTDLCLFSLMLQYEWFSCANGRAVTGRRICCVYSTAAVANCYYSRQFYISLMPLSVLLPESQMFFILVPRLLWPSLTFFFFFPVLLQLWQQKSQMPSHHFSLNNYSFLFCACSGSCMLTTWEFRDKYAWF